MSMELKPTDLRSISSALEHVYLPVVLGNIRERRTISMEFSLSKKSRAIRKRTGLLFIRFLAHSRGKRQKPDHAEPQFAAARYIASVRSENSSHQRVCTDAQMRRRNVVGDAGRNPLGLSFKRV
jgi:hypothetical protein